MEEVFNGLSLAGWLSSLHLRVAPQTLEAEGQRMDYSVGGRDYLYTSFDSLYRFDITCRCFPSNRSSHPSDSF